VSNCLWADVTRCWGEAKGPEGVDRWSSVEARQEEEDWLTPKKEGLVGAGRESLAMAGRMDESRWRDGRIMAVGGPTRRLGHLYSSPTDASHQLNYLFLHNLGCPSPRPGPPNPDASTHKTLFFFPKNNLEAASVVCTHWISYRNRSSSSCVCLFTLYTRSTKWSRTFSRDAVIVKAKHAKNQRHLTPDAAHLSFFYSCWMEELWSIIWSGEGTCK